LHAYPDCSGDYLADTTSSQFLVSYDHGSRSKQMLPSKPTQRSPLQQQCLYNTFPQSLNSGNFHAQHPSGNFHISDVYTVNHDSNNIIKIKPKASGTLKVMVKQPLGRQSFDILIGLHSGKKYLTTATNGDLQIGAGSERADFACLSYEVHSDLVAEELSIVFRASNSTTEQKADCLLAYLEIEFRKADTLPQCKPTKSFSVAEYSLTKLS
jgi:hypothetical protein